MADYGPLTLSFPDREDWVLSNILRIQAARYGEKVFLTEPGRGSFSYRQMDELATRVALGLMARDICPGDRVMLFADNCYEYIQVCGSVARDCSMGSRYHHLHFGDNGAIKRRDDVERAVPLR
jgi:acyl-CoA synthetase (AMP-forming)/AMP-acid ligase II